MKLRFIYKVIPIPVLFIDKLVRLSGKSYGMFVAIKKEHKDNVPLLEHEITHCRQFYRTLGLHGIFYWASDNYRLKSEIEAYCVTIKESGYSRSREYQWIIASISKNYNLNINIETIKEECEKSFSKVLQKK